MTGSSSVPIRGGSCRCGGVCFFRKTVLLSKLCRYKLYKRVWKRAFRHFEERRGYHGIFQKSGTIRRVWRKPNFAPEPQGRSKAKDFLPGFSRRSSRERVLFSGGISSRRTLSSLGRNNLGGGSGNHAKPSRVRGGSPGTS